MNMAEPLVEAPVLFEERAGVDGQRIGIATLNTPKTLNGLSLEMTRLLATQLRLWADDAAIACVLLQGAGEKAFCAGGDLHGLYRSMRAYRESGSADITTNTYAAAFFEEEYRLDYFIHTYPKPLLCWGHGIVMGGGIGLMSGASHRVVTERSKLAMPEISIGLFPDVGGSWLLARVPRGAGLFLALTGAPLNAGDAIYAGLADVCIESSQHDAVVDALVAQRWSGDAAADRAALTTLLNGLSTKPAPGPLQAHLDTIEALVKAGSLEQVVAAIVAAQSDDDPWLQTAQATLVAGAPGSARLSWELQQRAAALSLADTFRLECIAALHVAAHGDFAEGIRALLIDKDRTPHWSPATLAQADARWADTFLVSPWPADAHPLADLDSSLHHRSHA
ncbi:Enoyl-CoA hydratase/carnithine racemase [Pseudoxanthomonas sp. GM95]|uniref:enoyl-CoA hydratase/isomerase family protein n=1 Tax=Pseudoxanthomonas sp. GM95 TaxID=1881043 RepID=UPI0008D0E16F|nr:enoyl-CoA hydratase/isomerase family protein [Pseudoxanthomonas sp. GM95]SEL55382.1 Enoyl-CoA hydratase/carnithine racemase [Pseudoxanthomonas sp. GM95]